MKTSNVLLTAGALILAALPGRAAAQQSRIELIDQAREEFSDAAAAQLLLTALNPALGGLDSLWAVAGYELAATQLRLRQDALASVWLRWVIRHGAQWPMDRTWFPPTVLDAYDVALRAVPPEQEPAEGSLRTTWGWPARFDQTASGTIEATSGGDMPALLIMVIGRNDPAASRVNLAPGTYELEVSAEGYESRRVTREVLPGVTTSLEVELPPLLPPQSHAAVSAKLVRIRFMRGGEQVCGNGFIATTDGFVVTSYGLVRGQRVVDVVAPDGREVFSTLSIAATDPDRNLAVLKLPRESADPIRAAGDAADGQYTWSVHSPDCSTVASARTRLTTWRPTAPVQLSSSLPEIAQGSPLVNRDGLLIGLVSGTGVVIPAGLTQNVIEQARRTTVVQVRPRGGFPWKWAGAGAAAAGIAVALLGGGGGGGGNAPPPPPTTGGITITFPN